MPHALPARAPAAEGLSDVIARIGGHAETGDFLPRFWRRGLGARSRAQARAWARASPRIRAAAVAREKGRQVSANTPHGFSQASTVHMGKRRFRFRPRWPPQPFHCAPSKRLPDGVVSPRNMLVDTVYTGPVMPNSREMRLAPAFRHRSWESSTAALRGLFMAYKPVKPLVF